MRRERRETDLSGDAQEETEREERDEEREGEGDRERGGDRDLSGDAREETEREAELETRDSSEHWTAAPPSHSQQLLSSTSLLLHTG